MKHGLLSPNRRPDLVHEGNNLLLVDELFSS